MSGFENFTQEAAQIELEIERKGIALGIDWGNPVEVRQLARDALNCRMSLADCSSHDPEQKTRVELFGLAQLMLTVMRESAAEDIHTHGGGVWKAFARALWAEHEAREAMADPPAAT